MTFLDLIHEMDNYSLMASVGISVGHRKLLKNHFQKVKNMTLIQTQKDYFSNLIHNCSLLREPVKMRTWFKARSCEELGILWALRKGMLE